MAEKESLPKVALVTGGSRGIGAATVQELARQGWQVAFTFNTQEEQATEVAEQVALIGGLAQAYQLDLADSQTIKPVVETVVEELGAPLAVVANAGLYERASSSELAADAELWDRALQVNLSGNWHLLSACHPHLLEARRNQRQEHATAVVISSIKAHVGNPQGAHYAAAKAGGEALVRSLALDWAPEVRVNGLVPGFVDTDLIAGDSKKKREVRNREVPLGRVGRPEEMAQAIEFLVSKRSGYITGQQLHVNGGKYFG